MTASEELGSIKIAAIDNGLAFPFKHPDEWRTCNDTHTQQSLLNNSLFVVMYSFLFRPFLLGVATNGQSPVL